MASIFYGSPQMLNAQGIDIKLKMLVHTVLIPRLLAGLVLEEGVSLRGVRVDEAEDRHAVDRAIDLLFRFRVLENVRHRFVMCLKETSYFTAEEKLRGLNKWRTFKVLLAVLLRRMKPRIDRRIRQVRLVLVGSFAIIIDEFLASE